ncbi:MAG: FHA domain-containing protein [Lachnospiraceae bacterium]|nr:FHA domain-containing protein [Lachnospiraceae bacterium]
MKWFKTDEQNGRLYFDIGADSTSKQETDLKLVLEQDIGIKMLLHNRIEGIVPVNCQYIDEALRVYYETDGMQTLEQRYHSGTMTVEMANRIMHSLLNTILSTEPYFMKKENVVLSEECIFLSGDGKRVWLCYYPLECHDVYDGLKTVAEFLMKHLAHNDRKEITFFYGLYDMISDRTVTIEDLAERLKSQEIVHGKKEEKRHSHSLHRERIKTENSVSYRLVRKSVGSKNIPASLAVPQEIVLQGSMLRIGRKQKQDINLVPAQISREHAVIYCEGEKLQIEDKNSLNGTYVNGRKISAYVKVPCSPGDIITFADIPYELVLA